MALEFPADTAKSFFRGGGVHPSPTNSTAKSAVLTVTFLNVGT